MLNRGEIKKIKIATFDIEANDWTDFLIGGFYDGNDYITYNSIDEFLKIVLVPKYRSHRIFAHFGGRYDFLFLLDGIFRNKGYKCQMIEVNGRILQLKIYYKGAYYYFCDSFSILPASLDKITKAFNVNDKKQSGAIDFSKKVVITEKLLNYLKADCLGLYQSIAKYQELLNNLGGNLKITLASTSLDLFLREFLPKDLAIPNYPHYDSDIRKAYFGGRVEVFKKYGKNLNYYDFNSLYPSVMADNYFPVGNPVYINNYKFKSHHYGFVYIETFINKTIPPLPFRFENKLMFPNGYIKGWYAIPYLLKLQELKIPFKTRQAIIFPQKEKLFSGFVNTLYDLRLKNKKTALEYIIKLLLNNLYGKFGQKTKNRNYILRPETKEFKKKKLHIYDEINDLWYTETDKSKAHILPGIAAYVTSYAQLKLFDILNTLENNVYYCDTDSIVTDLEIETSDKLGFLKKEYEIKEGFFVAPKLYAFETTEGKKIIKAKGFNIDDLEYESFKNALYYNDFSGFEQEKIKICGFKRSLIAKNNFNKSFLYKEKTKKSIKNLENKREFIKLDLSKAIKIRE